MRPDRAWFRITDQADTADVWIYDEIGYWGTSAQDFVDQLKAITAPKMSVHINSPGGEVFDGIAIYNCLKSHPANVEVRVEGLAASAASFIAMAGDKITVARNATMMIHDASGLCIGDATDMQQMADLLAKLSDNIADIYAQRAGGTVAEWRERMLAETWYTGAEAVDAGLADEMTDPTPPPAPDMDNTWDLTIFAKAGRPVAEAAPAPAAGGQAAGVSACPPATDQSTTPSDKACPTHHTDTVETAWQSGTQVGRLDSPMTLATARAMYGWYDAGRVEDGKIVKDGCKLPHHEVSTDGEPGAANLPGVRNALSRLPQSDIPAGEQDAVRTHLQAHLDDAPEDTTHVQPADDGWSAAVAALLNPDPTVDDLLARLREAH
jgi:ATP-dependent protease ClpP protease subunit